ncbi:autoinducer 2 ABC transporter substrate-binding protein [Blastococcus haudaquaticus]|uniref:Monosaccharide ABC transporter substrate-binding protein, CUT2 family n=1 Tax=Blastococcus haudaquaticus TaxID=1938745 RepID=A0A286H2D7_9ACTN|nr:autoinducer 2 ABC transporter substrate-binding protein [Blastococcus haudaquaticus]SOE01499.1 monosaccharide ABC transporter substrate-binding protein, CUT2 family [Blastococcus haudaquaticus]
MKRSVVATASLAITVLLASGCSETQSSTTGESAAANDGGTRVAFVSQVEGIPYFNGFDAGAQRAAEEFGVEYEQAGPATVDATEQVRILDNLVSQGFDAIAISPLDPTSINSSITRAQDDGVQIATSDADAPDSDRSVFVSQASDEQLGATVMDQLADATGGTGQYGIISGSADSATFNAWIDAAEAQAAAEYPDMELVGGIRYTTDTAQALEEAQNLMTAYPDLAGIIAVPSTAVPGVGQAVTTADKIGTVAVTGFGSPQTAAPFLESGAMTSTVLWNVEDLGYLTVWALAQLVEGNEFAAENEVPGLDEPVTYDEATGILLLGEPSVFTAENYADYDF